MSCTTDRTVKPISMITTSKNWVLPPRPKNTRKAKVSLDKRKPTSATNSTVVETALTNTKLPKQSPISVPLPSALPVDISFETHNAMNKASYSTQPSDSADAMEINLESPEDLVVEILAIELENYHLKTKLLLLIHDYKNLKTQVIHQAPTADLFDLSSTTRKRMFGELNELADQMSDLIADLNDLSHASPDPTSLVSPVEHEIMPAFIENEFFDFVNLEEKNFDKYEGDGEDADDLDDESYSACLSRMTSPSSESDEHLLMTTLTRSTTVSTTTSSSDKKSSDTLKFYDLPAYSEEDYGFQFENIISTGKRMSTIEEDNYNQVTDFLEEKLLCNDAKFYVDKCHSFR